MRGRLHDYVAAGTLGKSPLELLIQVYDGAVNALNEARDAYQRADNDTGYERIQRARRFITHLYTSLDFTRGGEVAHNLGQLYAFVLSRTQLIEATKDIQQIDDTISILKDVRSGWVLLRDGARQEPASETAVAKGPGGFSTSG